MSYDKKVFCMECERTIIESGGNHYLKILIEGIEAINQRVNKVTIRKKDLETHFLKRLKLDKLFVYDVLNCYKQSEIKDLLKCIKKGHKLVYEVI